jgi:hypothetical protein
MYFAIVGFQFLITATKEFVLLGYNANYPENAGSRFLKMLVISNRLQVITLQKT